MRKNFMLSLGAAAVLLASSLSAHAAPIASLACTGPTASSTTALSYYNLTGTQTLNIGSQSSGAGAGKVTFNPFVIHAALSQFGSFYAALINGTAFRNCILTSTLGGSELKIDFKLVAVSSVSAIASDTATQQGGTSQPLAYIEVTLAYGGVQVEATGANDGGTSPTSLPPGWNRVVNTQNTGTVPIS